MKLENTSGSVEVHGASSGSSFSIALNGKAFRVLSDTLYQNKIGSIVRELACNAYDAHVMAGKKNEPITIHLPDAFEPWFSVQDRGVGLSPESIKNVFTVYFESTKDKSNDSLGAFGLGAKTPFSYTDQFTVTSVFDGLKSIYGMYITENGVPDYSLMHYEKTTEENGVEIKISIKKEDFYKVRTEVEKQLEYFSVKPVIINGNVQFSYYKALLETPNTILYEQNWNKCVLIQGQVAYPLDLNQLPASEERSFIAGLQRTGIALIFNIGEIGVTASREGVEYTKQTINNILSKIRLVKQEVASFAKKELSGCKNDWERVQVLRENFLLRSAFDRKTIKNSVAWGSDIGFDLTNLPGMKAYGVVSPGRFKVRAYTSYNQKIVLAWHTSAVIIKDTSHKCDIRLKNLAEKIAGTRRDIVVIEPEDGIVIEDFKKTVKECLGGYDGVKLMSELEVPTVAKSSQALKTPKASFYLRKGSEWVKSTEDLHEAFDKEVVYAVVERKEESSSDYQAITAIQAIEPSKTIIGITKQVQEKIKGNALFVPVSLHFNKLKSKSQSDAVLRKMLVKATIGRYFTYSENIQHFEHVLQKTTGISDFKRIVTMASEFKRYYQTQGCSLLDSYDKLGVSPNVPKKIERMQKLVKHLKNKYPLLEKLKHNLHDQELAKYVARYVELEYNAELQAKQPNQTI